MVFTLHELITRGDDGSIAFKILQGFMIQCELAAEVYEGAFPS